MITVMLGKGGIADDEVIPLFEGKVLVLGRSRNCDVSLHRFDAYLELSLADQARIDTENMGVSGKHLRLSVVGCRLRMEHLGSQGVSTFNGQVFQGVHEADLTEAPATLRLGQALESYEIRLIVAEQFDQLDNECRERRRQRRLTRKAASAPAPVAAPISAPIANAGGPSARPQTVPATGPCLVFVGAGGRCSAPFAAAGSVAEALEVAQAPWEPWGPCHGAPSCWGCKHRVLAGREHVVWSDADYRKESGCAADEILACQCTVTGPVQLERID